MPSTPNPVRNTARLLVIITSSGLVRCALASAMEIDARTVYLIRHAESRYNAGVKGLSLSALVRERDHGLSERGVEQCQELRSKLESRLKVKDADAAAITAADALSSPLRRALQTAYLGLGKQRLVVLPEGREHCAVPVFARDSVGTPRSSIQRELRRELGGADVDVDVSKIECEQWWTVAEPSASIRNRVRGLLLDLHNRAYTQPIVYVGHSRIIRELFRQYGAPHPDFQVRIVENCAVIKLNVAIAPTEGGIDDPVVQDATFLFDTSFRDRYFGEP